MLIAVLSMMVTICHAQAHLSFMGISFNNTLDVFCDSLVTKTGIKPIKLSKGESGSIYERRKFVGDFMGINKCTFFINRHERSNNVTSMEIEETKTVYNEGDIHNIVSRFDKIYGKHEVDTVSKNIWYVWKNDGGSIEIHQKTKGIFFAYTDSSEIRIMDELYEENKRERKLKQEKQTVKEICGIPFGTSREKAKEILENKYGIPDLLSDKEQIVYKFKSYAGITFDRIIFLFQSDGYRSYLNGCVFILEAKSVIQAKEKRDLLYYTLRSKYDMYTSEDKNGFKYYMGGYSPVSSYLPGFLIEILKFDSGLGTQYSARLMYGRYNYVKEEF